MKWFDIAQGTPAWILSRRVSSFQRFFELGQEESASPFLDARAKRISRNLLLKSSITSALLLILATGLWFFVEKPWWPIPLAFVYLLVGTPALIAATEDIVKKHAVNIDVLMTVAAFGALSIGSALEGALLLVLFALCGSLEDTVTLRAKSTLCALDTLVPATASVVGAGGHLYEKAVADVKVGELIAVRSGEVIPLDGIVRHGEASISMAHMTGESRPHSVGSGRTVPSGAQVLEGFLEVEVQVVHTDSTVAKLIQLITRAHSSKPRLSQRFEQWGRWYALCVILGAFLLLFLFPVVSGIPWIGEGGAVVRAVAFLITASPCALILAVPITYVSALGASARRGAILKGSVVLDRLGACDIVAFDKTGTLTEGVLGLEEIIPLTKEAVLAKKEVLRLAAALERHAVHPVARAITEACTDDIPSVQHVEVIPGEGVAGSVFIDGKETALFIGKAENAFRRLGLPSETEREKQLGKAVAALAVPGFGVYLFVLGDRLRPESPRAVEGLKQLEKEVVMLTGDAEESALHVGRELGIDEVRFGLVPEQKLEEIALLSQRKGVLMVGDGINDAPALARATVGASMGQLSSASAREASDIVLLHNNLDVLVWLFKKAASTHAVVIQNLIFALSAMTIGVGLSIMGQLPLWLAVTIHEGSTLVVGMNALRLLSISAKKSALESIEC